MKDSSFDPHSFVNSVTAELRPYPMEELTKVRQELQKAGRKVYDFGTGDPKIPTWAPIRQVIASALPEISQYPSVRGIEALRQSQLAYLKRRFGITNTENLSVMPTQGSKEAVFNIGLSLIGRDNGRKRTLIYPDPGYPVYRASALFAGGIACPVKLVSEDGYLLKPWQLPKEVQSSAAAIWLNYPHNPTGARAPWDYLKDVVKWCHDTNTVLLSDDCYVDIYDPEHDKNPERFKSLSTDPRPFSPLQISNDRVLCYFSLSKRSGLTGYRSGMVAGDARLIELLLKARANFGVGSPDFVQAGATLAWSDDEHVAERRKIFAQRLKVAWPFLKKWGLVDSQPDCTFYLWCRVPSSYKGDDVSFVRRLSEFGIIASPSQWLSEGTKGFFRLALVPDEKDTIEAMHVIDQFISSLD
jgi:succinyldiaminopimelate transaminase